MSERMLVVFKNVDGDATTRLGTITFNDDNQPTLATLGQGPDFEKLELDWTEISGKSEVTWKMSQPDEIDGKRVTRVVGETAAPGDDDYIYGVLDTLERKYGYRVRLVE